MFSIEENTLFFRVNGELTIYQTEEYLKQATELLDSASAVVVDMYKADKLDTAGFQLLVSLKKTCAKSGKQFDLVGMGGSAQNFMALFGFDICEIEKDTQ